MPESVNPPNSKLILLRDYQAKKTDGLGMALAPLIPFYWAGYFVTMPFHKKHEAGKDEVLEACSEHLSEIFSTIIIQPKDIFRSPPAHPAIDLDAVCPGGREARIP
jgi:hypothetical protein